MGSVEPAGGISLFSNPPPGRCLSRFDGLRGPVGLSSVEILWVWLEVRFEREKVEMPLSASERGRAGTLGLVSVISPWLCLTRGGLEPFAGWPTNLDRSLLV